MRRRRLESGHDDTENVSHDHVEPMTFLEVENNIVWRFPIHLSQSSIGGKTKLSNACTLIALKIAELIHLHDIEMPLPVLPHGKTPRVMGGAEAKERVRTFTGEPSTSTGNQKTVNLEENQQKDDFRRSSPKCPPRVIGCLINGIVDGNEAYWKDAGNDSTRVYNLPDAIKACGSNFMEVDFKLSTGTVQNSLPKLISVAVKCPLFRNERRLMFVMIGCIRTVLIVYDRDADSLTLFDTHMHLWHDLENDSTLKHGALISTCAFANLNTFADWVQQFVFPDMKKTVQEFEISLVQLSARGAKNFQNGCNLHQKFRNPVKFPVFKSQISMEEKENLNVLDYPVLREILSRPPLIALTAGVKRRAESEDGGRRSGAVGKKARVKLLLTTTNL